MQRVVVLGRGGAGKSVFAAALAAATGLPATELDSVFWVDGMNPMSPKAWRTRQRALVAEPAWILDGDLGPHDVVEPRFGRADTIVILDLPLPVCAWRAWRRGREAPEFWRWMRRWRTDSRPVIEQQIADCAPGADVVVLRNRRAIRRFVDAATVTPWQRN